MESQASASDAAYETTDDQHFFEDILPPDETSLIMNPNHSPADYLPKKEDNFDRNYAKDIYVREMEQKKTAEECFIYMSKFFVAITMCQSSKKPVILYFTKYPTVCSHQLVPLFTNNIIKIPLNQVTTFFWDLNVVVNLPHPTKKDKEKKKATKVSIFKEFMNSSHFKRYNFSCFDPTIILGAPTMYFGESFNLYTGLQIQREHIKAVCDAYQVNASFDYRFHPSLVAILSHIRETLCNNNIEIFNYVLNWLAYLIQNPGMKTQVMIIFVGPSGCGKSTFYSWLKPIFGDYMDNVKTSDLGSNFIGADFNEKFLVCIDEWNIKELNHQQADSILKNIVTDANIQIEAKYVQRHTSQSHNNLMASTNYLFNIAPSSVGYFRRLFIVQCGQTKPSDYFIQLHQIIGQKDRNKATFCLSMHLWARFLYERDIVGFIPNRFPVTSFQVSALTNGWKRVYKWWYNVLKRGYILDKGYFKDYTTNFHQVYKCRHQLHQFCPDGITHTNFNFLQHQGIEKNAVFEQFMRDMQELFNVDPRSSRYNKTMFYEELKTIVPYHDYSFHGNFNMMLMPSFPECIKSFYLSHTATGMKISTNPFDIYLGVGDKYRDILELLDEHNKEKSYL